MIKRNIQYLASLLLLSVFCATQLASAAVPTHKTTQAPKPADPNDSRIINLTRCLQDETGTKVNKHCKNLSWACYAHLLTRLAKSSTYYKELVKKIEDMGKLESSVTIGFQLADLLKEFSDSARPIVQKEVDEYGHWALLGLLASRVKLNKTFPANSKECQAIFPALFPLYKDEL